MIENDVEATGDGAQIGAFENFEEGSGKVFGKHVRLLRRHRIGPVMYFYRADVSTVIRGKALKKAGSIVALFF
ncbi:hypothetical protein AA0488_0293 [Kozakia baliensis NRIC 0488]|nr:hypothetical protein AA0488_0293 [Kozakia baliensis NRIC 0488]GEL64622.1 hypothetical protein KBA01_19080 [Kozakia baliensis]